MILRDSLLEIADKYDTFFLDAYGVFYAGNGYFYPGALDAMETIVKSGKTIVIVSNSSHTAQMAVKSYKKKGMVQGRHYNIFVTAGEVARDYLIENDCAYNFYIPFQTSPEEQLYEGTKCNAVNDIRLADTVFIPFPIFAKEYVLKQYAGMTDCFMDTDDNLCFAVSTKPFEPVLKECVGKGMPMFNANPDLTAITTIDGRQAFHLCQGNFAQKYEQLGGKVLYFGKPHKNIYDYAFRALEQKGIKADKSRTIAVGDTWRTDILGGNLACVSTALCVKTGVTAGLIMRGNSHVSGVDFAMLNNLVEKSPPDYLIDGLAKS